MTPALPAFTSVVVICDAIIGRWTVPHLASASAGSRDRCAAIVTNRPLFDSPGLRMWPQS